ncbi:hypothetical protein BDV34DRAFT_76403 [Aspergillus parasiticus]|uniref:Secreted protein n=1 Tax=Aspergillus parasiticus TaxID=5067 RepID=A0A5N6DP79_ASPPA|nr:hypothetical protein BDV34DRAFT_76403 [Aspergillus parasiticus]
MTSTQARCLSLFFSFNLGSWAMVGDRRQSQVVFNFFSARCVARYANETGPENYRLSPYWLVHLTTKWEDDATHVRSSYNLTG